MATKIEWTDETWNPVTGCTKVSPACANCYAERMAGRRMHDEWRCPTDEPRRFSEVRCHENRLDTPLHWRKPRRVFLCSMGDLFHEAVPDAFIDRVFASMALCPQHTFQVLTKRPERMRQWFLGQPLHRVDEAADWQRETIGVNAPNGYECSPAFKRAAAALGRFVWPLQNVWLGVTAENQEQADKRIPLLLQTPAAKRFVSCEPLLGPVDLERVPLPDAYLRMVGVSGALQPTNAKETEPDDYRYFTRLAMKLDWVIAGGETGPGARPSHPDWFRSLRDECERSGVPYFFKQWGDFRRYGPDHALAAAGRNPAEPHGGATLDGAEWKQFPEVG